jgi:hypothetical protein
LILAGIGCGRYAQRLIERWHFEWI